MTELENNKLLYEGKEYEFDEIKKIPLNLIGIYAIKGKYNNKYYVGQTCGKGGIRTRFGQHKTSLRYNYHCNKYLQSSYNKHGEDKFKFIILEVCNKNDNLNIKEGYWINKLKSRYNENGWNIDKVDLNGKKRQDFSSIRCKKFKVLSPAGKKIKGINAMKFAREHNLNEYSFSNLAAGRILSTQGWKSLHPNAIKRIKKIKKYKIISPQGEIIEIENIPKFAKDHGLPPYQLWRVIKGKIAQRHMWKSLKYKNNFKRNTEYNFYNRDKLVKLVSPELKIHIFKDYVKFSKKYNLNQEYVLGLINGWYSVPSYKKWITYDKLKIYATKNKKTNKIIVARSLKKLAKKINTYPDCLAKMRKRMNIIIDKKLIKFEEIREDF